MNASSPVIKTLSGPVKGLIKSTDTGKKYFAFHHIPYAKPLEAGAGRFKDPQPVQSWTSTLDATKEGDAAYQFDIWRADPVLTGGDNCLALNVYSPNVMPNKPLPVHVWIHGGGFIFGSGSTLLYGPDYLVEKDVIVVTINYRLNIFGFLSLKDPKLGVPGNAGLKDQTMALRWVKENIGVFGGDVNNITISGESAGGASVNYHLISPLSKGLFNRAIIMSGSVFSPWAQAPLNYGDFLKRLAVLLGLDENVAESVLFEAIVKTDPIQLVQLDLQLVKDDEKFFGSVLLSAFLPQVEPYVSDSCFLPESVTDLSKDPWSKHVDVIMGGCADEGLLFHYELPSDEQLSQLEHDTGLLLPPDLRSQLTPTEAQRRGTILKKLYYKDEKITSKNVSKLVEYMGEKHFWHGIYLTVVYRLKSPGDAKTYLYCLNVPPSNDTPDFYKFTRTFSNIPHNNGTCHSEDIPFLFKPNFVKRFKNNDDNYLASQRFLGSFVEFVKCGSPKVVDWQSLKSPSIDAIKCLNMGRQEWNMTNLANIDKIRVWEALYEKNGPQAKY